MIINRASKKPIHSGDVTHHQDQSICPVNFKTKNIKNKITFKLIPPFV